MSIKDDRVFDPAKLQKLNNSERLKNIPPGLIWNKLGIPPLRRAVFAEIGAGTGFFSRQFLRYTGGGTLYALDISPVMVNWMNNNIKDDHPGLVAGLMDDNAIPLEDAAADLVYTINLHHELNEPGKMLEEMRRILKPEGRLFIVDWKKEPMERGPGLEKRCTPRNVEEQLTRAGFTSISIFRQLPMHFLLTAENHICQ